MSMAKSPLESGRRGRRLRAFTGATRPCAEGKIISNEMGIGVLGEQAIGS